jgi:probable addiction module antidote protein
VSEDKAKLIVFRDNPVAIAEHLTNAFETNDLPIVAAAINDVMRAQNVKVLAAWAGLRRDRLYYTFGGDVNPQLGRVMELFAGLDVQLVVKPLAPRAKPPQAKRGRPLKRRPSEQMHERLPSIPRGHQK